MLAEPLVHRVQGLGEAVLALADRVLARVVGAVGEPQLEVARPGLIHHVDALEEMVERLATHPRVGVGDAAELVVVVLEDVRVDRAQLDAVILRGRRERAEVVDLVPGDVQGDAGRDAGVLVDLRGVGDLLVRVARYARLGEDLESRAGVAEGPGRQLDVLPGQDGCDRGAVDHERTCFLVALREIQPVGSATSTSSTPSRSAVAFSSGRRSPTPSAQWCEIPVALHASTHSPGSPPKSTREVVLPICSTGPGTTVPVDATNR